MQAQYVFVGGPADGTFQTVHDRKEVWYVRDYYDRREILQVGVEIQPFLESKEYEYRRLTLGIDGAILTVYVEKSLTFFQGLVNIVDYYGQRKERREINQELIDLVEDTNKKE